MLLEQSERGEIEIVTSMIALTEVAFTAAEQKEAVLSEEDEQAIDDLLGGDTSVLLIEFSEGIARRARGLMREAVARGWSLRPADAIHLASAQFAEVRAFHTYDRRLFRFGDLLDFPVEQPSGANLPLDLEFPDA